MDFHWRARFVSRFLAAKVMGMHAMLAGASSFNQSLGQLSLKSIRGGTGSIHGILEYSGISTCNYDATLRGWAENPDTPDRVQYESTIEGGLTYSDQAAMDSLAARGWVFAVNPATYVEGVDCTPPDAPTNLAISEDGTTLTGKAEAGSTVEVKSQAGESLGTATSDRDGNFSIALCEAQTSGQELIVTATDAAGNISEPATVTAPRAQEDESTSGTQGTKSVSVQKVDDRNQSDHKDFAEQLADTGLNLLALISGALGLAGAGVFGLARLRR